MIIKGKHGEYEVMKNGDVIAKEKTFCNKDGVSRVFKERKLKHSIAKNGYRTVCIDKKHLYVHRLVAAAFVPSNINCPIVNHIDGDKANNDYSNLEWCTYSHNLLHAYSNKLREQKVSDEAKLDILSTPVGYGVNVMLAKRYGISTTTVWRVRKEGNNA